MVLFLLLFSLLLFLAIICIEKFEVVASLGEVLQLSNEEVQESERCIGHQLEATDNSIWNDLAIWKSCPFEVGWQK